MISLILRGSGKVLFGAFTIALFAGVLLPEDSLADRRERRQKRQSAEEKKLHKRMHLEYGGVCGKGLEKIGGYPPNNNNLFCRYHSRKGPVRHGKYYKWWPDGDIRVEGSYWQGKRHGVWTSYMRNGRKRREDVYYAGQRRSSVRYDETGREIGKKSRGRGRGQQDNSARGRYSNF